MYIFKNAWKNIIRNKGRNILIGIIVIVIAASSSITLAIRESANDILNIILPSKPFIHTENKLIYELYGFLPYLIEKLNLVNEPYFNLKFIEDDEYLKVDFNKLFERKRTEHCFNIEYSITINCKMSLTNFRVKKELIIPCFNITEFNGFLPSKIITIQKNTNDDYYSIVTISGTKGQGY